MNVYLKLVGNDVHVVSCDTAISMFNCPNEAYGKGWLKAKHWAVGNGHVIVPRRAGRLPSRPGYYKRALFGWVPVTKAEYMRQLYQYEAMVLRVEAPIKKCVIKQAKDGWTELWSLEDPPRKLHYAKGFKRDGSADPGPAIKILKAWAIRNRWEVVNGEV